MVDPPTRQPLTEKHIKTILGELIAQRELLEGSPVSPTLLTANRASIAYWQSRLGHVSPQHTSRRP